ncbi:hypothetical protein HII31_01118, partial [Pseudocercospora fuligena]
MPAMDIDSSTSVLEVQRSPPMKIASPRIQPCEGPAPAQMPIPKLDHDAIREKAKKRKKNKKKGMPPAAPAVNVIKGFQTPVTSGGEESDVSTVNTPRFGATKDLPSLTSSPALRPSTPAGGISTLRQRLDALALDNDKPSLARVLTNASDATATPSSAGIMSRASKTFDFTPTSAVAESNPFGGFSYVASRSLLDGDDFMLDG